MDVMGRCVMDIRINSVITDITSLNIYIPPSNSCPLWISSSPADTSGDILADVIQQSIFARRAEWRLSFASSSLITIIGFGK